MSTHNYISSRLTRATRWTSDDGHAVASVENIGNGSDNYAWQLTLRDETVASGEDLRCPCGSSVDALASLASFIDAWSEALGYESSDNRDIFPMTARDWAEEYAEEFAMWTYDYENSDES